VTPRKSEIPEFLGEHNSDKRISGIGLFQKTTPQASPTCGVEGGGKNDPSYTFTVKASNICLEMVNFS
jgi:hypothetical protein